MGSDAKAAVTTILENIRRGDVSAKEELFEVVYGELHKIAHGLMKREAADHLLQPTALVHEAFLRLIPSDLLSHAPNRGYFFAAASRAMRQILVEHARERKTAKRGGAHRRVPIDDVLDQFESGSFKLLELDEALKELSARHERQCQIVTFRFFGGLDATEVAEELQISVTTVERDFRFARAWLRDYLEGVK